MNVDDRGRASLQADIGLVVFITLVSLTAILVGISANLIWNLIYLGITLVVMLITYFYGLIPGMLSNLLFIFCQVVSTAYINVSLHQTIPLKMAFWLILPGLLSGALAVMTSKQQLLQLDNHKLRNQLTERGAFDVQTNLRTLVAFSTDARVYIENHRRFHLPVTMLVFRIRYYQELQRMLSEEQNRMLLRVISDTLTTVAADNDLSYFLDPEKPTWGMILHSDEGQAQQIVDQIKQRFCQELQSHEQLKQLDTSLTAGMASWNTSTMDSPYDLMKQSIRETEYDV
ncbi:GGDEF domain-containing protein [Lactobacillus sp. LC28-10]|uniref:GGDEF domain-containing protein n=1 Tax=Secundilactobacillus angelensis TaxID=2722706 RepID=A0ABX1L3N6_9LACO|nr:GGDEF domain-containing protein [Secundilactobacillus angelensis]MCH5462014.1 GGDEF domain-containing protein [Secundilactobacillus angelensis]NLR18936.1 GGDEF domain-containing protein [Secundilactobacillus angelensis]